MRLVTNDRPYDIECDMRTSLLDLPRDHLHLTGTEKGCNQGAGGASTVMADSERNIASLALAVQVELRHQLAASRIGPLSVHTDSDRH